MIFLTTSTANCIATLDYFIIKKIQIKICTQYHLTKIYFFLVSPNQYHFHLFTQKKKSTCNIYIYIYIFSFSFLAAKHI